jgi:hypothetical protein
LGDWRRVKTETASRSDVFPEAFRPTIQVDSGWKSISKFAKQRKSRTTNLLIIERFLKLVAQPQPKFLPADYAGDTDS